MFLCKTNTQPFMKSRHIYPPGKIKGIGYDPLHPPLKLQNLQLPPHVI